MTNEIQALTPQTLEILDKIGIGGLACNLDGVVRSMNETAASLLDVHPAELINRNIHALPDYRELAALLEYPQIPQNALEILIADQVLCLVRVRQMADGLRLFVLEDLNRQQGPKSDLSGTALYTIVHDLKAPISAIKSYADLVATTGELNPKQKQFLQRIDHATRSMSALVGDLLDVAWIDSQVEMETQPVNLAYLVNATVDMLQDRANASGVTLHITVTPGLPTVPGDPRRLERVFTNLISNAIKYSPEGESIEVRVVEANNYLTVAVRDRGTGIPPEYLPKIFERFYRVPGQNVEGTGLGLYVVKSIVERHGGHVEVKSVPGEGTTFMVVLPIKQS